jgi:chemotaxis response regulator CheB
LIVIGASTGGPGALRFLLDRLPADFPAPIVIVQHIDAEFAESFVAWLVPQSRLPIREAVPGSRVVPGTVLVAARGRHVVVTRDGCVAPMEAPPRAGNRPSVDVLFESAAEVHGANAVGVLLSGMGRDGAAGLKRIRDAGGRTIAQDEASSVVFGMPRAAIELGAAQAVLGLPAISAALASMSAARRPPRPEQRD